MKILLIVWLTGVQICLMRCVAIVSLVDGSFMVVTFISGFVLGFAFQVMIQLNMA